MSGNPYPTPTPRLEVTNVIPGLAPAANIGPGKQLWQRNVPNEIPVWNNLDGILFLPSDFLTNPSKKFPLVISIHGRGGFTLNSDHTAILSNPEGFIKSVPSNYPAIVFAPEMRKAGDRTDFFASVAKADMIARFILDAIQYLRVDPKRVTVTGLSYGGAQTEEMMINYQAYLAGAAPVAIAPLNRYNYTSANTCRYVSLPTWIGGNSGDGVFAASEWTGYTGYTGYFTVLSQCPGYASGTFKSTIYNATGHSGWDQFYQTPEVQTWLRSQVQP